MDEGSDVTWLVMWLGFCVLIGGLFRGNKPLAVEKGDGTGPLWSLNPAAGGGPGLSDGRLRGAAATLSPAPRRRRNGCEWLRPSHLENYNDRGSGLNGPLLRPRKGFVGAYSGTQESFNSLDRVVSYT